MGVVTDLRSRLAAHEDSPPVAEFFDVADVLLPKPKYFPAGVHTSALRTVDLHVYIRRL
jgi:hypothetical protein